ncbi:cytokine receptor family member b1 [Xyrauchen texanus]|uniref:cytokine receptor family member b1 n=1 Tax=Xyrauchen texanus TaxID=154827 RepID=UPI002242661E|nr:cytokine receptor family member b1 [Xyrauchen texanus]XP_052004921.1 cytokine receptor family member b1 [Xyrauchen texanus]XP_052004922.1 cytokine receptor family member b1 [Xyrauchen texanus]XP_052004923.1 cytokine receptor family member b1 [Xyrauchen texanus]
MSAICIGLLILMPLYFTVLHTIPAPVNFKVLSHNFNHILQWSPGRNSPLQTVFNLISSCGYGKQSEWLNIRNTTVEMSGVLEDIYTSCTFVLWASLDNMTSSRVNLSFTPYEETIIGPPTIHLSGCGDCLKINISLPKGSKKKHRLLEFYNSVSFNLSWKKAGEQMSNQIFLLSGEYELQNLQAGTQYCVSVLPQINVNRNTLPSAWQCEYTSKEEPRGVVYLVSWSLGAAVSGLFVLVLAVGLVYTGSVCKIKSPLPKALINVAKAHYLHPEQTLTEYVSLPDVQLMSKSKNNPTKNNQALNVQQDSQEEKNAHKTDTDDEDDYDDENEEASCTYMGCVLDHSGLKINNSEENSLHVRSGVCHTEDQADLDVGVTNPSQQQCEEEVISEVSAERTRPPEVKLSRQQSEESADASGDSSGNVNLFSVTLSALVPQEDEGELCEPLIPKPLESEVQQDRIPLLTIRMAKELEGTSASVQSEGKIDVLMSIGSQGHLSVCSPLPDVQNELDTGSGYMVTHSGHMHNQNTDSSEESDYCDKDYITR